MKYADLPSEGTWIYSDDLYLNTALHTSDGINYAKIRVDTVLDSLKDYITDIHSADTISTYKLSGVDIGYLNHDCHTEGMTDGKHEYTKLLSIRKKSIWQYLYFLDIENKDLTKTDRLYCTGDTRFSVVLPDNKCEIMTADAMFNFNLSTFFERKLKLAGYGNHTTRDICHFGVTLSNVEEYAVDTTRFVFDQDGGLTDESCGVTRRHRKGSDTISVMDLETILDHDCDINSKLFSAKKMPVCDLYTHNKDMVVRFAADNTGRICEYDQITAIMIRPVREIIKYCYRFETENGPYTLSCADHFQVACL